MNRLVLGLFVVLSIGMVIVVGSLSVFSSLWTPVDLFCPALGRVGPVVPDHAEMPRIYFITPTVARATQKADLTQLVNTLQNVKNLVWVLVEDAQQKSDWVVDLLRAHDVVSLHLAVHEEADVKLPTKGSRQRNAGLDAVEKLLQEFPASSSQGRGVVYFGDDDNAYSMQLFKELRMTKRVSMFAVGLAGAGAYERPVVDKVSGRVLGLVSNWRGNRKYPLDMAGFAFHTDSFERYERKQRAASSSSGKVPRKELPKHLRFAYSINRGSLETWFISLLINGLDEVQALGANGTQVLVWHRQTVVPVLRTANIAAQEETFRSKGGIPITSGQVSAYSRTDFRKMPSYAQLAGKLADIAANESKSTAGEPAS